MKQAIIIFTRVPIPGQTKTRLMPFLSGKECSSLHQKFISDIHKQCKAVDADIFVYHTPEDTRGILKGIIGEGFSYFLVLV